jgi:hypothetical protein
MQFLIACRKPIRKMDFPEILELEEDDVKKQIEILVDYLMELRQASL